MPLGRGRSIHGVTTRPTWHAGDSQSGDRIANAGTRGLLGRCLRPRPLDIGGRQRPGTGAAIPGRKPGLFRKHGIATRGEIGDEDPLRATEGALRTFPADEIIIVTPPLREGAAGTPDVVAGAREHFALPIKHVVVQADEHVLAPQ